MLRAGEGSTKDQEQWRYDRAHARVQTIKGFYIHASAFVEIKGLATNLAGQCAHENPYRT